MQTINRNNEKIGFILIAGFSPDAIPMLEMKKALEARGFGAIASGFFGSTKVADFQDLTAHECVTSIASLIDGAAQKYDRVFGIGLSLGGAFLLEHAKKNKNLDGIVSIGTPFRLKNKRLIKFAQKIFPLYYPLWKRLQKIDSLRLNPIGAGNMMIDYLQGAFVEKLELIQTPVLFLHSKKDFVTDYKAVEEFAVQLSSPRQQQKYFTNGSHTIDEDYGTIIQHALDFFDLNNSEEAECGAGALAASAEELTLAEERVN